MKSFSEWVKKNKNVNLNESEQFDKNLQTSLQILFNRLHGSRKTLEDFYHGYSGLTGASSFGNKDNNDSRISRIQRSADSLTDHIKLLAHNPQLQNNPIYPKMVELIQQASQTMQQVATENTENKNNSKGYIGRQTDAHRQQQNKTNSNIEQAINTIIKIEQEFSKLTGLQPNADVSSGHHTAAGGTFDPNARSNRRMDIWRSNQQPR